MSRRRLARVFWIGAAAILVVAALVAVTAIVAGSFSDADARILLTLAAALYCGSAALAGLSLVDAGRTPRLGRTVAVAAPVALACLIWSVWSFVFEGSDDVQAKLAWSAVLALAAGLLATTSLLIARRRQLLILAAIAGTLGATASTLSILGIWSGDTDDVFLKLLAVIWILAALAFFLLPILQRFTSAGAPSDLRVLAALGDVELVASRRAVEGIAVQQRPRSGERLVLRRRS